MAWRHRYAPLWPTIYWGLTGLGTLYVIASILGLTGIGGCAGEIVACDAAAYYYADSYTPVATTPQFGYSPAFLWAFAPFRLLSFDAFVWVWAALHVVALIWLRAGWMLAIPGINEDVIRGNVTVFIAVAVVLALRYPVAWAFPLLTKVLPGVGMVWHLARREWRALVVATGTTAAIILIGLWIDPQAWMEWAKLLAGSSVGGVPWYVRLPLAIGLIGYAGLTSRAWLIPVGMILAWSGISPPVLMMLAAIPRLTSLPAASHSGRVHVPSKG